MSSDWLDQPESTTDSPVAVRPNVPETIEARDAKLVASYAALTPKQQTLLQALQDHYFNFAKANASLKAISADVDKKTYWRWKTQNQDFAYALLALKAQAVEALDNHRTILRVAEVAEDALTPRDVYFKGIPTGEQRPDYTAALKATELQMRHKKLLNEGEKETGGFGGRNINLTVQVVLPSGELRDIKRAEGVVIDVPEIEVLP